MISKLKSLLEASYEAQEGSRDLLRYSARHGIKSAGVLTVYDDEAAATIAQSLEPRIEGKTVVEIGGGFGLLAFHMASIAKRVFCIEANPVWASVYIEVLLKRKPKNVSYLFGAADEYAGLFKADVAIICTHSGLASMKEAAALFAPVVIDVYGEVLDAAPDKFDQQALALRENIMSDQVTVDAELPPDGAEILWRKRGQTEWHTGVVDFCWMGIEAAIKTTSGENIIPAVGDEWKLAK